MRPIRSICVYCGSSTGRDPGHAAAARELGARLAAEGIRLVYGGGAVGLMGVLADAVMEGGGEVVGVLPRGLFSREVAHSGISELIEVESMHERKQLMFDLADAFVALPGGLGTLEELMEVITWAQLGIHHKPVAVLDAGGYWQPLSALLHGALAAGYVTPSSRRLVLWVERVDDLLPALTAYVPPPPEGDLTTEQI